MKLFLCFYEHKGLDMDGINKAIGFWEEEKLFASIFDEISVEKISLFFGAFEKTVKSIWDCWLNIEYMNKGPILLHTKLFTV